MSVTSSSESLFQVSPAPVLDTSLMQHTLLTEHTRYVPGEVHGIILAQTSSLRQMLMCVPAGHSLPRHLATCNATVTVIEGAGVLTAEGEGPARLQTGVHLFLPKDKPHAVTAEENLALLATFASPAPEIRFLQE